MTRKKINETYAKWREEYVEDIEIYVTSLAYEVERKAREEYVNGEELKQMIKEKMDRIRQIIELRDGITEKQRMFEKI